MNVKIVKISILLFFFLALSLVKSLAINDLDYFSETAQDGSFPLYVKNEIAPIYYSEKEFQGVIIAIQNLQVDIEQVSNSKPKVISSDPKGKNVVIIGTVGYNSVIDKLIEQNKIDGSKITGKWETFIIQTVDNPLPGISKALIIAGSDKRGTIFGIYDVAEKIGVSPWYWWADVPVKKHTSIYFKKGCWTLGEPKVKYRGIFINDEDPALKNWVIEKFGGFNHIFYKNVFELILRLKGNFLWPAMWGKAFCDDDSLNAGMADTYGVVISTSHHEPMMRAHDEWSRYGSGPWDYSVNKENLEKFWRNGIERMGDNESIVTIGMRGDGDEPMSENTVISLLEEIVKKQRSIIEEVTHKPANRTPQVWALYKEVQEYYDKGMRVPDDVTLLLCDDNWGNVRILPKLNSPKREGGYGMYYHFDFVGGPRSYRWLNTVQIERVWEQMNLTYRYGVNEIWLVNVGDIKPMELPISFFLDFAWNPDRLTANNLPEYYTKWSEQQFGEKYKNEIGKILALYTKYNSRRKPEMIDANTYSIIYDKEADRVLSDYQKLVIETRKIADELPEDYYDAFFQLVQFPVEACANLNEMYISQSKNYLYARQRRISANNYAQKVKECFDNDIELTHKYHTEIAQGKWNHMMSQKHIGYRSWNEPRTVTVPEVETYNPVEKAQIGLTINGTLKWWPNDGTEPVLSEYDPLNNQIQQIIIYNQGTIPAKYSIKSDKDWVILSSTSGIVESDIIVDVRIDWETAPEGNSEAILTISGDTEDIPVHIPIRNLDNKPKEGFIENNGIICIEAANYQKAKPSAISHWSVVSNLGRTHSAVISEPVTSEHEPLLKETSAYLEYDIYIIEPGSFNLTAYLSPTLNFLKSEGLHFALSVDDDEPVEINMHEDNIIPDWRYPAWWNKAVSNNIMVKSIPVEIKTAGMHNIKFWKIDPGVVLQRIELMNVDKEYSTYLGPPQSKLMQIAD